MEASVDVSPLRFSTGGFLLRFLASVTLPVVVIATVLWWVVSSDQIDQALDVRARTAAALVDEALAEHLSVNGRDVVVNGAPGLGRALIDVVGPVFGDRITLRVTKPEGTLVYASDGARTGGIIELSDSERAALRGIPQGAPRNAGSNAAPVDYSVPVSVDGDLVAVAQLQVDDDRSIAAANRAADDLKFLFVASFSALLLALIPLCWWSLGDVRRQFHKTRVLAMSDDLTGLPNRTQFHQRLDEAIAGSDRGTAKIGLVLLDLDGFKAINDTGGHAAGDRLLRRVALALGKATRRNELACRLGGDEFAVLVPRLSGHDELAALAERLHAELDLPVEFTDGRVLRVSASMGLAVYPDDARTSDDLVNVADRGMYSVKAARKARLPRHRGWQPETATG